MLNLSERRDADRSWIQSFARKRSRSASSKPEPKLEPCKIFPAVQPISYSIEKCTNFVTVLYDTLIA